MEDLEDLHSQVQEHLYGRPMGPSLSRAVISFIDKTYDILTSEDPKHFKTLISYLMTPSNEQQHLEAKSLFNVYKKRYSDQLVTRLTEQVESPGSKARAMSALLLGNLFNEAAFRNSLRAGTRLAVKGRLLNCVNNERDKSMIKSLGDTLSGLAADDAWPELMNFMFDRVGSDDFWLQESALLVFSRLGGDILGPHVTRLHDVFTSCLGNVGSADVRIAAVVAGINCVRCLQRSSDWYRFQALLPIMMQCLEIKVLNDGGEVLNDGDEAQKVLNDGDEAQKVLNNGDEAQKVLNDGDNAQEVLSDGEVHEVLNDGEVHEVLNVGDEALSLLIELAKTEPRFLKGHLVVVVEGMLRIAEAESLQERTRLLAIEFVTTLVEAREPAPRMLRDLLQLVISRLSDFFMRRKLREFISRLFAILMRMLLADIEDDSEWNSAKNEDEDESSSYRVGKECLHRLATALGRKIAYKQLSRYLAKPDDKWQFHGRPDHKWHKHLAALIALAQIAKGRSKVMIPNLEQVVTEVLNSFQDPHPRVRWAAINAIGELCNHGGPSLLNQYLNRVLAALDLALDDVNPRVQAQAVSVVLNFNSHCRPHILAPYLDGKLDKLILLPPTDLNIRVLTLANSLETSTDVKKRGYSAVELGELFEEPLGVLTLDFVQRKLLTCVGQEDDESVMKNLCHTIVTVFNVSCIQNGWPELFSCVERWASGDSDLLKEAAMLILGPLARVLTKGLNEGQEVTPRDGIGRFFLKLCFSFFRVFRKCSGPVMMQDALFEWAHQSHDTKLLRHLKKYCSRRQLVGCVSGAFEIAQLERLERELRHLAIDFVITLGEGRCSGYRVLLIDKLFDILMSDIETEAASHWAENENDDAGESGNYSVLKKFINRLAFKLDKYSVAWPRLKKYLASPDGKKRFAAIVALAPISKVLKETKNEFGQLLAKAIYEDVDPRVRLAALNATGELSTDLDPDMQFQYQSYVLPALADAIYKDVDPRLRLAAINATRQFTDLDPDVQFQYHSYVVPALAEAVCDFEYPEVQERAFFAMVDISKYPLDTSPYLVTVGTLLKEHASCRLKLQEVRRGEDIASVQTRIQAQSRIQAIRYFLDMFEERLPTGTWSLIQSSLSPDQIAEVEERIHFIRE